MGIRASLSLARILLGETLSTRCAGERAAQPSSGDDSGAFMAEHLSSVLPTSRSETVFPLSDPRERTREPMAE